MDRKEAMNVMEYYVRLRKKLEKDYEAIERTRNDLFGESQRMHLNPSDSEARKQIEEVHEEVFQEYKSKMNEQHELLGRIEDKMTALINEIEYGLDIEEYMSKYGL